MIVFVLLHISVKAVAEFDKKRLRLKVKYLWFRIYELDTAVGDDKSSSESEKQEAGSDKPEIEISELEEVDSTQPESMQKDDPERDDKAEMPEQASEPKAENESSSDADKKQKSGKSLKDRWEEIKPYFPVAKRALRKLLKMIRLYDLELHLTVGGNDPHKAGMNFARANQVFYPALALLCTAFSVKIKKTEINCDFNANTFDISGGVVVMVRPSAVIALAAYLGFNYLKIKIKQKKPKTNNERKKDNADD